MIVGQKDLAGSQMPTGFAAYLSPVCLAHRWVILFPGPYSSQVPWQMMLDSVSSIELPLIIDGCYIFILKWWGR